MIAATAQAAPNIAFIKQSGEKLDRTNRKVCLEAKLSLADKLLSYKGR